MADCTACGACITDCPERILIADRDGKPQIDFSRGGCTFCGNCAEACEAPVFDRTRPAPWALTVQIGTGCLTLQGILCDSCKDACLDRAILFPRSAGRVPVPAISAQDCTGCGACISVCPSAAISAVMSPPEATHG
jgi:ferredoxin-type protein NapF